MHSFRIALPQVLLVILICFGCGVAQAKTEVLMPATKSSKANDHETTIRPAEYFHMFTAVTWREYITRHFPFGLRPATPPGSSGTRLCRKTQLIRAFDPM
jgi:hypothetical protein